MNSKTTMERSIPLANLKRSNLYSRVTVDGNTELDYLDTNLDEMELGQMQTFRIPQFMVGRPDLISFSVYQNVDYGWIIMWANNIIDPFEELYAGKELVIPSLTDYYNFYNENAKRRR